MQRTSCSGACATLWALVYRLLPQCRCVAGIRDVLQRGRPVFKIIRRGPFLIQLPFENTDHRPSGTLVSLVEPRPEGVLSFAYVPGFPASDFPKAGPSAFAIGYDEEAVDSAHNIY